MNHEREVQKQKEAVDRQQKQVRNCLFVTKTLLLEVLQEVSVLLVGCLLEDGLLPQIWRQIAERIRDGIERRFG